MKKLATILALTAVVANLGVSAVFAQVTSPVTGTQDIDCTALSQSFGTGTNAPANFAIGSTGSRTVSTTNDNAYAAGTNSAYFNDNATDENSDLNFNDDATDTLTISSNVAFSCGHMTNSTFLSVDATQFNNGTYDLMTYGSDGIAGGTLTATDYRSIFSVMTSADAVCTGGEGVCVLALGSTEMAAGKGTFPGENNVFDALGPHNGAFTVTALSQEAAALLLVPDSATPAAPVVLYGASKGFNGTVSLNGLDYNLAVPSNVVSPGTYTSDVTYTLYSIVA